MKKSRIMLATVLTAALLASGCGGTGSAEQADPKPSKSKTETPKEKAPEPSRCKDVPDALAKSIASGVPHGKRPLKVKDAAAVRSKDYQKVFMIALRFEAPGLGTQTGVWASNSLEAGGGILMSVDAFAKDVTVWPDGSKTNAGVSFGDDGSHEAADCVS